MEWKFLAGNFLKKERPTCVYIGGFFKGSMHRLAGLHGHFRSYNDVKPNGCLFSMVLIILKGNFHITHLPALDASVYFIPRYVVVWTKFLLPRSTIQLLRNT